MELKTFNNAMQMMDSLTKFTHKVDKAAMQTFFLVVKDDFTDEEFQDVCLRYVKTSSDFPAPADLYALKKKEPLPDSGELLSAFLSSRYRSEGTSGYYPPELISWSKEVGKYFTGKIPYHQFYTLIIDC